MNLSARPYLQKVSFRSDVVLDFDTYPLSIPAIKEVEQIEFHPDVTFIVGENGTGKSTFMEAIALSLGLGPEGGTTNVQFRTAKSESDLNEKLRMIRSFKKPSETYFLRAESLYNLATYMDEVNYLQSYGGKSLHAQSHGEAVMTVLQQKLRGGGLYLFDEPEAGLSPSRQLAAITAVHELVLAKSQLIIATHSPMLLAYPRSKIYHFDSCGISEISFRDCEQLFVARDFLNNHESWMAKLLSDGDRD